MKKPVKHNDPEKRITDLWAFIGVDEDGDEGLCAFEAIDGRVMPMVASDEGRRDLLIPMAERIVANIPGSRIELRRFTSSTVEQMISAETDGRWV